MSKPTEAQIKEFWEWCGRPLKWVERGYEQGWETEGIFFGEELFAPSLDVLFKYAVPKLFDIKLARGDDTIWVAWVQPKEMGADFEARDNNPALALFWAIWEVIKQ